MKRIPDDDDDDDDDDAAVFISELVSPRLIINPVTSVKFRVAVHFSTRPASFQPNHRESFAPFFGFHHCFNPPPHPSPPPTRLL